MADSNVSLITVMGTTKDKKDEQRLPWYFGDPDPTAEVVEEIVNQFHTYAILGQGKLRSGNEEEKRIARTFLAFCEYGSVVRNYFKENANRIDSKEARDIADRGLDLVDEFYDWFHQGGQVTNQDMELYMRIFSRWRKVVRRFILCIRSEKPDENPAETKQNNKPAGTGQKEIVEVKPGVLGITVNIKELARRFWKWVCSRSKD